MPPAISSSSRARAAYFRILRMAHVYTGGARRQRGCEGAKRLTGDGFAINLTHTFITAGNGAVRPAGTGEVRSDGPGTQCTLPPPILPIAQRASIPIR